MSARGPFPVIPTGSQRAREEQGFMAPITPAYVDPIDGLVYVQGREGGHVFRAACAACSGEGEHFAGRVPYGSTTVALPPDVCETCYGLGFEDPRVVDALRWAFEEGATWADGRPGGVVRAGVEVTVEARERFPDPVRP